MKLFFLLPLLFYNVQGFLYLKNHHRLPIKLYEHNPISENFILKKKINSFLKLIRAKNIPATTFLCFSGGWIMNPSVRLFQNNHFWISTLITNLIMSASMAINDIFDMEVDRINSPERPLITGEVSKKEAVRYTVGLLGLAEILGIRYLPLVLQYIIHFATIFTLIYTPVLKRILFVKNLSCGVIVAFSLFFTGISSLPNESLILVNTILQNPRFPILQTGISLIFSGSVTNEILLDIRDSEGDAKQGILTIPNTFGKMQAFFIVYMTWYITILINTVKMTISQNIVVGGILSMILYPQLVYLHWVYRRRISNEAIQHYLNQSNRTMIFFLFYLCFLSKRF
jgi:4-hydroxybenzoate polyprenyltransferase